MRRLAASLAILSALALAFALACGGGGRPAAPSPTATAYVAEVFPQYGDCPHPLSAPGRDRILSSLSLDGRPEQFLQFTQDEPITMKLSITSCYEEIARASFETDQRFDFVVEDSDGDEVWRWSHGWEFERKASEEVVESVTYAYEWDLRDNDGNLVRPGHYVVRGLNLACKDLAAASPYADVAECQDSVSLPIEITEPF